MQPQAKTKTSAQTPAQNDSAPSIQELLYRDEFNDRHIGPNDSQIASMLADLNLESLQDLIRKVVPPNILATSVNSLANSLVNFSEVISIVLSLIAIGIWFERTFCPDTYIFSLFL